MPLSVGPASAVLIGAACLLACLWWFWLCWQFGRALGRALCSLLERLAGGGAMTGSDIHIDEIGPQPKEPASTVAFDYLGVTPGLPMDGCDDKRRWGVELQGKRVGIIMRKGSKSEWNFFPHHCALDHLAESWTGPEIRGHRDTVPGWLRREVIAVLCAWALQHLDEGPAL